MHFIVHLLFISLAIISQGEAGRGVARNTCRLCSSCGGDFPNENGKRLNEGDYGAFRMYGDQCDTPYGVKCVRTEPILCCTSDNPCRICQSCGGDYSHSQGKRLHSGDWGPWMAYGAKCSHAYTKTWEEVSLCCKSDNICRLCVGCGPGLPEVGRVMHEGDWGKYQQFARESCTPGGHENYGTFGDGQGYNPSLCCASED